MGSAPATLALLVLQTAAGTLNVADLSRIYLRDTEFSDGAMVDLENTPRAYMSLAWPMTHVQAEYAPRFLWVDVLGPAPSPTLLLHRANLSLSWQRPRTTWTLVQTVAVGDEDFTQLGGVGLTVEPTAAPPLATGADPTTQPDLDLLPSAAVLSVAAEETSASVRHELTRRWSSELRAAFGFSGGANAEAQQFLPRQRNARVEASLGFRRSRLDDLRTGLIVAQVHTSNDYDHWLTSLMEVWSVRFSHHSGGALGAGASFQDTTGPNGFTASDWVPVATGSVWRALPMRDLHGRVQLDVGYRPDVNVLAGTLQSRLFTTAQAGVMDDTFSLRIVLGAAQTFPTDAPDANELLTADLVFDRELLEWLALQLGAQLVSQDLTSRSALATSGTRWLLYAGLEGRLPEARF